MAELTVHTYSHHFVVRGISPRGRPAVNSFAHRYVQYGMARGPDYRYVRTALKVFAASNADRSEFRFHINLMREFKELLELMNLTGELVHWVEEPYYEVERVVLPVFPNWKAHDYQEPIIEYMSSPVPPRSKFVDLQTGKGKSYCAMSSMAKVGERVIIIVKPMYLEKWIIDIRKTFDIATEDLMVIRGSAQLMALLLLAQAGELTSKIVLVSNKTLQNWLKLWERYGKETLDMGYACSPAQLHETLRVGYRLIDEVHQDFHLNFKIDLYTHVNRAVSLSATFKADDDFLNKMYSVAYPMADRFKSPAYDKYVAVTAVIYRFKDPNRVRTKDPASKNYSHHLVEQSIIKSDSMTSNYLAMIKRCVDGSYMVDRKKGQRLIVFCASIEMCTIVTDYLRKTYPALDVRRYVEEDPFDNLMQADASVTTLQSAGTAVDIDNLTTVVLTVAISSTQSSLQSIGRLRKLKDGTTPEFLYFVCEDVPKHIEYHEKKKQMLDNRVVSHKSVFIDSAV